jgi:hypothetical protein
MTNSLNEFDLKAEQHALIGQYEPVACRCGWKGTQADLRRIDTRKDRGCPVCGAIFKRLAVRKSGARTMTPI